MVVDSSCGRCALASASSDEAFVVEVIAALEHAGLEAIIVGSVAAILQGAPVTTQDLDILVPDTVVNRKKITVLGKTLGARPRSLSALTSSLRIDAAGAAVDVLFDELSAGFSFQLLRSRSIRISLGEHTATVARLEDVIASKAAANRPKDRAQLPILRDTLKVRRALEPGASARKKR
jgi:predicted nucleotidyltransferase